jgi:hypothetical protein
LAMLSFTTGRSASHLPHTRPVSPEASLVRATRAYGPVWPDKRLAGYYGRCQHALLSLDGAAGECRGSLGSGLPAKAVPGLRR